MSDRHPTLRVFWPPDAMPNVPKNHVAYTEIRSELRSGDIALSRADWHPRRRLIAYGTDSEYSHAAMIGWCNGVMLIGEAVGKQPVKLVTLSSVIREWPGYYDIYRVRGPFSPAKAWAALIRATGSPYGYGMAWSAFFRRVLGPLWPLFAGKAPADSDEPEWPRDCSGLVSYCCRQGGKDPSPESDALTVPGRLANEGFSRYLATIHWTPEQAEAARREDQYEAALAAEATAVYRLEAKSE